MKLEHPFIQLPLKFDARLLAQEIQAIEESAWLPHPQGFAGNDALTLITPYGDKNSDLLSGPMQPTEYLLRCPYLMQVMQTIGGVWGRTRLMRLSGKAEVERHVDVHYYWRERMRVHVPIVTQPTVKFSCGDQEINMAAGECWIFDTWRWHRVLNDDSLARIHLVADTVGGEQFWQWLRDSKPAHIAIPGWKPQIITRKEGLPVSLRYESSNMPDVMTPWELRDIFSFLFGETLQHPSLGDLAAQTMDFCMSWSALWAEWGNTESAYPAFGKLRDQYLASMARFSDISLQNGHKLVNAIAQSLLPYCVNDQKESMFIEARNAASSKPTEPLPRTQNRPAAEVGDARRKIVKPVIVVSSPRSGS
ncbi:MAG: aspartyl/asparaginyl beta-hydroxylase domain-containing protein, partial [Arenimonas sp.]